jgi:Protein of unknown function (DUF3987)/Bifunctional DNA primase/polymerase, N-terminal
MTATDVRQAALSAYSAGLCVCPPKEDGSKAPGTKQLKFGLKMLHTWLVREPTGEVDANGAPVCTTVMPSREQVLAWYGPHTGLGAAMGRASGNVELFDIDERDTYLKLLQTAASTGLGELIDRIRNGYEEETPREDGGWHLLYRCPEVGESMKLASRPAPTATNPTAVKTLIETKGEGGYAILAPSNGRVHPTGGAYRLIHGDFATITEITPEERRSLFELARSFDEMPVKAPYTPGSAAGPADGDRPGDLYNQQVTWGDVLEPHGWVPIYERDGIGYWRRPGKDRGISATTNAKGTDTLIVFSTSTDFETAPGSYDKFGAYALLNHGGDYRAAAKDLSGHGYRVFGTFGTRALGGSEAEWPVRAPLPRLPEVPTMPADLVPESLRPWVRDIAERLCIPLEMVAIPAIVAVSGVAGRTVAIRPARFDDFAAVPNLWGAIVARPGWLKSPAIKQVLAPIYRLVARAQLDYEAESIAVETQRDALDAQLKVLRDELGKTLKEKKDITQITEQIRALKEKVRACAAFERRYVTQDSTVEKLGEMLRENPRGLSLVRDELAGWLATLERQGREGEREFFLEAWAGDQSYTFDRIGRGTIHIPALTLSILGGIQPGKLRRYIEEARTEASGADGLLQRFQLLVWPDSLGPWKRVDRWPDNTAKHEAIRIFEHLDMLDPLSIGAELDPFEKRESASADDEDLSRDWQVLPYLRFAPDAQAVYDAWRDELEQRVRGDTLAPYPAFESHMSKFRSLMPSLALLFHLLDITAGMGAGPVSLSAARRAAAWCEFLEFHARKLYAAELDPGVDGAAALAEKIEDGAVLDGQTVRDIYRNHWSGLSTAEAVQEALRVLEDSGWLLVESVDPPGPGRPSEIIRLHPDFRRPSGG